VQALKIRVDASVFILSVPVNDVDSVASRFGGLKDLLSTFVPSHADTFGLDIRDVSTFHLISYQRGEECFASLLVSHLS